MRLLPKFNTKASTPIAADVICAVADFCWVLCDWHSYGFRWYYLPLSIALGFSSYLMLKKAFSKKDK